MAKTITKDQYYQLVGLRAAAEQQIKVLNALKAAARSITDERDHEGKPEDSGHTMDFIWGSRDLDEMLDILKIEVTSETVGAPQS